MSPADSTWFTQYFLNGKYADEGSYPGSWFIHDSLHSTTDFVSQVDADFKFKLEDFNTINSMVVDGTLYYDTPRNNTYNLYPFAFQQLNPLVYFDYTLNGKNNKAYSFLYPKDSVSPSEYAFLVIPGNGNNSGTELVQGNGYHNSWCYITNELKQKGDVYAYMKPNEDARAIFWNQYKVFHEYLVYYLDAIGHPYGLNYLTELIATIHALKKNYCKVIVLGLSEGGYSGLLASLIARPDASLISAGYAVGFDTSYISYNTLQYKFDSLVFYFDRDSVKNTILSGQTRYMFTWGDSDQVNLMQGEHDSKYTQLFLNDSSKCQFYYNYYYHSFPQCNVLDTFSNEIFALPKVHFQIVDSSNADTLITLISNCGNTAYSFDLFRNDTFYYSFIFATQDITIPITDSGKYYLKNIVNINGDSATCSDTIIFNKNIPPVTPEFISDISKSIQIQYNNPVINILQVKNSSVSKNSSTYYIYDIFGTEKMKINTREKHLSIDMQALSSGIYFLKINDGVSSFTGKIIKL